MLSRHWWVARPHSNKFTAKKHIFIDITATNSRFKAWKPKAKIKTTEHGDNCSSKAEHNMLQFRRTDKPVSWELYVSVSLSHSCFFI